MMDLSHANLENNPKLMNYNPKERAFSHGKVSFFQQFNENISNQ
jgi:hypothetical protein